MIFGKKAPSEACCPHGVPREMMCKTCMVETHRGPITEKIKEQRLEIIEGEKASGDFEYGWQIKKGEKRVDFESGQDMVLVDEKRKLTAVFDGMGGMGDQESGARASSVAAELLPEFYDRAFEFVKTKVTREDVMAMLKEQVRIPDSNPQYQKTLEQAEKAFFSLPQEVQMTMLALNRSVKELNPIVLSTGGKTTITAGRTVELPDGRTFEVIAQLGDSGVVKVSEDGTVKDVAPEDTFVDELVEAGEITPEQAKDPNFVYTGKHAEVVRQQLDGQEPTIKNIGRIATQALGNEYVVRPRMLVEETKPGDGYYFMSDGLRDVIRDKKGDLDLRRIGQVVDKSKNPKEACANLNAEAVRKDSKFDDKGVVAKVRSLEKISPEELKPEDEDVEEISAEDVEEVAA